MSAHKHTWHQQESFGWWNCGGCGQWLNPSQIEAILNAHAGFAAALQTMVRQTELWNASVESIIEAAEKQVKA